MIENVTQSIDEFDHLTTEFGAYFGQLIHSHLMKLRSQRISSNQAQLVSATAQNISSKTIVVGSVKFFFKDIEIY